MKRGHPSPRSGLFGAKPNQSEAKRRAPAEGPALLGRSPSAERSEPVLFPSAQRWGSRLGGRGCQRLLAALLL